MSNANQEIDVEIMNFLRGKQSATTTAIVVGINRRESTVRSHLVRLVESGKVKPVKQRRAGDLRYKLYALVE